MAIARSTIVVLALAGCSDRQQPTAAATPTDTPPPEIETAPAGPRANTSGIAGTTPSEASAGNNEPPPAAMAADTLPPATDAAGSSDMAAFGPAVFPADWCARVPADPGLRFDAIADISDAYVTGQIESCETTGLTELAASDELIVAWYDYLFDYTNAMLGCPLIFGPIEDGIRVFGPANTEAIGVTHPPIGRDDAARLIALYTAEFARGLALSMAEAAAVEAYLWTWADVMLNPSASNALWRCDSPPPPTMP